MDTPLVKILLIAAAIAITVGVTVLAWSIFNEGSAEVETDQDSEAISGMPGTRADGVRARIDNARACEALGSAHWYAGAKGDEVSSTIYSRLASGAIDNTDEVWDHPATRTDEGGPHCAAASDLRSSSDGLVQRLYLFTGTADKDSGNDFELYIIK